MLESGPKKIGAKIGFSARMGKYELEVPSSGGWWLGAQAGMGWKMKAHLLVVKVLWQSPAVCFSGRIVKNGLTEKYNSPGNSQGSRLDVSN
jgi:hypothetical protein